MEKFKWWGYRHVDGSIHAKRYFDALDIEEARESPFVDTCYGPFLCDNREQALSIVRENTK